MKGQHDFLTRATARLAALIEDQEWLFEVIRKEQTQLGRMDNEKKSLGTNHWFI
jgi:hypothetical protein